MAFDELLDRMEASLGELDVLDGRARSLVFELLDGIDALHRAALTRLGELLGDEAVRGLREADPVVSWLFDAYAVSIDEPAAADRALDAVRPYIHSHGGSVEVLHAERGVVRLRLAGTCSGCTSSAQTLRDGVEEALWEGFPGFVAMEVEEDESAAPHPPPTVTPVELTRRR